MHCVNLKFFICSNSICRNRVSIFCRFRNIRHLFICMKNPSLTPPPIGGFGVKCPPQMLGYKIWTPQASSVRTSACFKPFCTRLVRSVWCAHALMNKKKTRITCIVHPIAVAPPLTQNGPNLAVLVYGQTLSSALICGYGRMICRPLCTIRHVGFNAAALPGCL